MKKIILFVLCLPALNIYAQEQTFDIITYTPPPGGGWKKLADENTVQFSKEDAAKGTYCILTLFRSLPSAKSSKENFDAAWETVVKEMVNVSAAPEMQPVTTEDGWEVQSGYSPFQRNELKGIAMLVTLSGYQKMVNMLILTNTDVYEKEMTAFLESANLTKLAGASNNKPKNNSNNVQTNTAAKKDGFTFTTTNWDDGWVSTVQEDWVELTKANVKVLIHFAVKIDDDLRGDIINGCFNLLAAPRYNIH